MPVAEVQMLQCSAQGSWVQTTTQSPQSTNASKRVVGRHEQETRRQCYKFIQKFIPKHRVAVYLSEKN